MFTVFLCYLFYVPGISNVSLFHTDNECLVSFFCVRLSFSWLEVYAIHWSFKKKEKKKSFHFHWFSLLFFDFNFTDFYAVFYYLFSFACLGLNCFSFSYSLSKNLRLLIFKSFDFIRTYVFNVINFPLRTAFIVPYTFW